MRLTLIAGTSALGVVAALGVGPVRAQANITLDGSPQGDGRGAIEMVASEGSDAQWSPDGTRIMFVDGSHRVYIKSLVDGQVEAVFSISTSWGVGNAVWSPDGSRIAVGTFEHDPKVVIIDLATRARQVVLGNKSYKDYKKDYGEGLYSTLPAWAPDGRRIAFHTMSSRLVPHDTNRLKDVFSMNLRTRSVTRVSTSRTGGQANAPSYAASWSPNGERIAFRSRASNLVPGDSNHARDIFVKNLKTGKILRVSTSSSGAQANHGSYEFAWSPNGRRIAFMSTASNLVPHDTNGEDDIFVKNLSTGKVQRVSTDARGHQSDSWSWDPAWSPNGKRLAFTSSARNFVPGGLKDAMQVYVKNLNNDTIARISTTADGQPSDRDCYVPTWSPDGRRIAFRSTAGANLVPTDMNNNDSSFAIFVKTVK
jgi:Tol biopolymer transport system component